MDIKNNKLYGVIPYKPYSYTELSIFQLLKSSTLLSYFITVIIFEVSLELHFIMLLAHYFSFF